MANRIQIFSDGYGAYLEAVEAAFGGYVDYAQLIKVYRRRPLEGERVYFSPEDCVAIHRRLISGNPNMDEVNTSYVERHNLTMRMAMRRFTRLTNAFSKKALNHVYMVAIYTVWYNFMRTHQSLNGATPAMASGLAEYPLDMRWLVELINERAPKPKRGPYGIRRYLSEAEVEAHRRTIKECGHDILTQRQN